jgi:hypothetical protein
MKDECKQLDYVWQCNEKIQENTKISELGIRPVLIKNGHVGHRNKLYDSKQVSNSSMLLKPGLSIDTSKQRGQLVGMKKAKTSYIGQQKCQHDVIKQLTDPNSPVVLMHVRGSKHVGKTRFIQEVAYHFYRRNKFTFKINYIDLAKINSRNSFKDLLSNLEADCKTLTENHDDSASCKSEEDGKPHARATSPHQAKKYELLWVFDNAHALSDNHWSHFEMRIAKFCKYGCVKIIISSANKTFKGRKFYSFVKVGSYLPSGNEIKEKPLKMDEIRLNALTDMQAIDLLLSSCDREVTKQELGLRADDLISVHEHLRREQNIAKLKNLPKYILEFSTHLNNNEYDEIQIIEREKDKRQGIPNSHKIKTSQPIEIVSKNKGGKNRIN